MTRLNSSRFGRQSPRNRSGVALLIVIAMLALFATVGLAFVFYAEAEATSARYYRMAQQMNPDATDIPAGNLMEYAIGQLIYEPDLNKNPNSALAGFSLARSIYGPTGGTTAFNGLGRPRDTSTALNALPPLEAVNVPYTYPDINNPFLGQMDTSGNITVRSFYRNNSSLRPATLGAAPAGGEGDVRNVNSSNGVTGGLVNDSFWMDLGFQTMTAKNGSKYKPLFAFFVIDLDGRINLSAVGNYNADYVTQGATTSRVGLGAFEINPARVLSIDKTEIGQMFRGSSDPQSRFPSGSPTNTVNFPTTRLYNRVDYSGTNANIALSSSWSFSVVPQYDQNVPPNGTGWADWPAGQPHALGFDYANSKDSRFSPSNLLALLCPKDKGAANFTSDLLRMFPKNLDTSTTQGAINTYLVTPHSMALDTAHLAPFIVGDPNTKYQMLPGDTYPKLYSGTNATTTQAMGAGGAGEMTTGFQCRTAAELRRINLNRGFSSMQDRQTMAKELFDRLLAVTGALPPGPYAPFQQPVSTTDPQFKATKWLAQYAVNIVDFIDDDDVMTAFNWNPHANSTADDYVFGAERPRLAINEVFCTFDNDKTDVTANGGAKGTKYAVNVYAELYNPAQADSPGGGVAVLPNRYRMILAKDTAGLVDSATAAASPTGMPTNHLYDPATPSLTALTTWSGNTNVDPGDQQALPTVNPPTTSYYVTGPPTTNFVTGTAPSFTVPNGTGGTTPNPVRRMSALQSKLFDVPAGATTITMFSPTLVLQRLADTTRDEQPDPTQANYNPYVTVDYFPNITPNNRMKYINTTSTGVNNQSFYQLSTTGRFQPLEGAANLKPQIPATAKTTSEPQNTFAMTNAGSVIRFQNKYSPYYFLDRPLTSAAEVMNVPATPPWQIWRTFPQPFSAYNSFGDVYSNPLIRFLETVTVGDRGYNAQLMAANPSGIAGAGKPAVLVPGRININAIQDKSVLMALFDPQANSQFNANDVTNTRMAAVPPDLDFWTDLQKARPIAGFSDYSLAGDGTITIKPTLLNPVSPTADTTGSVPGFLFKRISNRIRTDASSTTTEYEQTEALRKVMNNMTFTSNTFAVWVTVGFFNVDANDKPTTEIGKADGTNTRHRAFAVIDRTQLVIPDQQLTTLASDAAQTPQPFNLNLAAVSGSLQPASGSVKVECPNWKIKPGVAITIDKDQPNEETVMAMSVNGNSVSVGCLRQNHSAGATVHFGGVRGAQTPFGDGYVLGNPGPQPNFNMRDYSYVVPFYSIID